METIAVYWEARIKVYGITLQPGLALGALVIAAEQAGYWSERLMELERPLQRFELAIAQGVIDNRLEIYLLFDHSRREILQPLMDVWLSRDKTAEFRMEGRVDMVFLHGPHFQDRFGIAETAFSALAKNDIRILLSGCAGTSMYLIFAEGGGEAAKQVLADTFLIPTTA